MRVIARRGQKNVTEHVPKSREWMTVLVCINASGNKIPSLYVFKGKRMRNQNLIAGCESGAVMSFQKKAWITDALFESWLDHFKNNVPGGVSKERPHLLICDGHGSHVTMATILKARDMGLHIVRMPPHTSHRLQPLDVSCFRPFKAAFRKTRAHFMHSKYGVEPTKEDLATIVSNSMSQALSQSNICAGFIKTGIWPWEPPRVQAEPLADRMEQERMAARAAAGLSNANANENEDASANADANENENEDANANEDGLGNEDASNVNDVNEGQLEGTGAEPQILAEPQTLTGAALAALADVVSLLPHPPSTNEFNTNVTSTNNSKPKSKRLRMPEHLKNRLHVTSDEMVQAKLQHQRQCEEAERIRKEQIEERKRIQIERKEAKEREKKRKEENRRLREERKAMLEREALERAALQNQNQQASVARPRRVRKKTLRMIESQMQEETEECGIIIPQNQVQDDAIDDAQQPVEMRDDPTYQIACSQGLDLFVNIPIPEIQDSQSIENDDETSICSLEDRRKKRKVLENESDSSDEAEERLKALDDLYRAEADEHLKKLGL